ncbi:kinesin-like protein [Achlya hypogyna]|uniref:Kinesin-like protein n=1 Tax=Achlya hypogyna TaxID=1202772 RepID=A0A1V9YGR2_ACHHY|nr:kinesin-like protein [Achlya hypogyna]
MTTGAEEPPSIDVPDEDDQGYEEDEAFEDEEQKAQALASERTERDPSVPTPRAEIESSTKFPRIRPLTAHELATTSSHITPLKATDLRPSFHIPDFDRKPNEAIRVFVRVRPTAQATETPAPLGIQTLNTTTLRVPSSAHGHMECAFDKIFPADATQQDVYASVRHLVADVVHGFNATIFAYGQTGTGKTHTILGMTEAATLSSRSGTPDLSTEEIPPSWGIIPRALFELVRQFGGDGVMTCAYLQVYNDKIYDLLVDRKRQRPLSLREADIDGVPEVAVQGLTHVPIANMTDVHSFLRKGKLHRVVRETDLNAQSSRSHAILQVLVKSRSGLRQGKLNLVDLAGSEKWNKLVVKPGVEIEEMKSINTSLSALGNCIAALTQAGRRHIPYRDSTLTRLLKDSLGGNTRTVLIATINGRASDETIRTIQFADRTRAVMQCVVLNPTPVLSPRQLQIGLAAARAHIAKLKQKLQELATAKEHHADVQAKLQELERAAQAKEQAIGELIAQNEVYQTRMRDSELQIQKLQETIQALSTPEKPEAKPVDWDRFERGRYEARSMPLLKPLDEPSSVVPSKSSHYFKSLYAKPPERPHLPPQPVLLAPQTSVPSPRAEVPGVCTEHHLKNCVLCALRSKAPESNQSSADTGGAGRLNSVPSMPSLQRKPLPAPASSGVCDAHQLQRCVLCQRSRPKAVPTAGETPETAVTADPCAPHRLINCVLCTAGARFASYTHPSLPSNHLASLTRTSSLPLPSQSCGRR